MRPLQGLSVFAAALYRVERLLIRHNKVMDAAAVMQRKRDAKRAALKEAFDGVNDLYTRYTQLLSEDAEDIDGPNKPSNLQYIANQTLIAQSREYTLASKWLSRSPRVGEQRVLMRINALRIEVAIGRVLQSTMQDVAKQFGLSDPWAAANASRGEEQTPSP